MRGSFVATALAAVAVMPAGASAHTLVVGRGDACRDARYSTIQSAVDASRANDTVRVCPGTYRESVKVPAGKDGLKLVPREPLGATIREPEEPVFGTDSGLVELRARRTVLRGFTL